MQRRGGKCEARHVFDAVQRIRDFAAVRMAVKQRKHRQDSGTDGNREIDRQRHQQPERDHRRQNARLHERHRHTFHAEDATNQHHADEDRRPNPERTAAFQACPKSDHDHDRDVVEPSERVSQPGSE